MIKKLNLGCSNVYKSEPDVEWINLDIYDGGDIYGKKVKVDVVWDLNNYPWPFEDNSLDYVHAWAIIEHLDSPIKAMAEIKRILKPTGTALVRVPHFSAWNNYGDPTHKWQYSIKMCENHLFNQGMKVIEKKIIFSDNKLLKAFNFIPNLNTTFYDRFLAFILPSNELYWIFQKDLKPEDI